MTLTIDGAVARLEGVCAIEEAETLLDWLRRADGPSVDLSSCEHMHTALLQTLLALRPTITGLPPDPLLVRILVGTPALPQEDC